MKQGRTHYKGYTLIELIVVLLIAGILLSIGAVQYSSAISNSKQQSFQSAVLNALSVAESYRQKYGEYPSTATLNSLFNDTAYFTTKPMNPYTGQPLQATNSTDSSESSKLGYFYYNVVDGVPQIVTNPPIEINLASGTSEVSSLPTYTISFTVKNSSGSAIGGAQIMIGGKTITTNSSGQASVSLTQGSYFYAVSKDGYNFYTANVNVTGNTSQAITLIARTYTVTIYVIDASTGQPVSGASVSGVGSGGTTDPNGKLTLSNVPAGSYTASVSAAGYNSTSKSITVNNNQQINITLARGYCTITFNIANGAGALVQLSDGSSFTLGSGGVKSVSKPCGEYAYTISQDGYAPLYGQVSALGNVSIRGTLTGVSGDALAYNFVDDTIVFSFGLADSTANQIKNRGIKLINSKTGGATTIDLYAVFKSFYQYMEKLTIVDAQAVAIGGGAAVGPTGVTKQNGEIAYRKFDSLPSASANYSLSVTVNIGSGGGITGMRYEYGGYYLCPVRNYVDDTYWPYYEGYCYNDQVWLQNTGDGGQTSITIPNYLSQNVVARGGTGPHKIVRSGPGQSFGTFTLQAKSGPLAGQTLAKATLQSDFSYGAPENVQASIYDYNSPDIIFPWSNIVDIITNAVGTSGAVDSCSLPSSVKPVTKWSETSGYFFTTNYTNINCTFTQPTSGAAFVIVSARVGLPK